MKLYSIIVKHLTYDNLGRRTSMTFGNGVVQSFGFDAASRLQALTSNLAGSGHDQTASFTYNPASQIASLTKSNDAYAWGSHYNVDRNYASNGLNQLTSAGATSLGYDARGNLTSSGSSSFTYASENFLKTGPGGAALDYDPWGRLYQTAASGVTTRFHYDGSALIAEYTGSSGLLRRYVHGPGIDNPIVWYEGSGLTDRRFLTADERGSIVAVSDSAGSPIAINSYDEYGIPASTNVGRFQYTGQTWLPELGMYYYKARIYSPTLGRFMQTDPIGYGDGMNMYAYVGNDPVNFVDPTGMKEEEKSEPPIIVNGKRLAALVGGGGGSAAAILWGIQFSLETFGEEEIVVTAQEKEGPCDAGPRITFSGSYSGTLFGFPINSPSNQGLPVQGGLSNSVSINASVPIMSFIFRSSRGGQISIRNDTSALVGHGLFLGSGPSLGLGYSRNAVKPGFFVDDRSSSIAGGASWGGGVEGTAAFDGDSVSISGGPRGGYGAYIAQSFTSSTGYNSGCF